MKEKGVSEMNQQLLIGLVIGLVLGVAITVLAVKDTNLSNSKPQPTSASAAGDNYSKQDPNGEYWQYCLNQYRQSQQTQADWDAMRACMGPAGYGAN